MKIKERILHALLFEALALILLTIFSVMLTGKDTLSMTGLAISLSVIAMVWNYVYNLIFDHYVTGRRHQRSFKIRLLHGAGFELGMIIFSFPVIMWVMQLGFLMVLSLDFGAAVFFFMYAIAFNWIYDIIRNKYFMEPIIIQ